MSIEKAFNRLQEDLNETADWNKTVTVRREDLELLLGAFLDMKYEIAERSKDDWCGGNSWNED